MINYTPDPEAKAGSAEAKAKDLLAVAAVMHDTHHDDTVARRLCEMAVQIDPNDPETHANYASMLMKWDYWQDAATSLDKAFAIDPHHPHALYVRGCLDRGNGHDKSARTLFEKALKYATERGDQVIQAAAAEAISKMDTPPPAPPHLRTANLPH